MRSDFSVEEVQRVSGLFKSGLRLAVTVVQAMTGRQPLITLDTVDRAADDFLAEFETLDGTEAEPSAQEPGSET